MANDYDNTNGGALFKNDKVTSYRSPQYRGNSECKCPKCGTVTKFWISAWIKAKKGVGGKFMSLAFTPDDTNVNKPKPVNMTNGKQTDLDEDWDDDIPF